MKEIIFYTIGAEETDRQVHDILLKIEDDN